MNDCAARELSDDPSVLSTLMHHGIDAPEMLYRVGFAFGAAQRFAYRPEIALIVTGDANAVEAKLVYDRSRYETATIERMLGHYAMLLTGIVKDPAQTLTRLPILTDCERKQVLCDWNETRSDYASPAAIHLLIEQRAAASPGAIAIVHQDARLTYGELDNRASRLAHHLRGVGVGPDRVVGVYLERSIEAVVALLAVLKAGGAYLPLDASSPKDRVAFILGDADVGVVLTSSAYADGLPDWTGKTILLDRFWSDRSDSQTLSPTHCNKGSDLALLIYTSGSTGTPKGVEITHASLINNVFFWDETHGLSEASGLLQTASFSFAVFQSDVFRALSFGKKLVICHREALLSPRSLFALARREQADFVELVPTLLRNLAAYARENGETLDLFRVLVVSADRWYVREHEAVRQLCGPQTRFSHVYGMSETTFDGTYLVATSAPLESGSLMPIGKPFPNVHAYILDANDMPVPVGVGGELCIGGVGLARGYHKRPDLSAERFVANPFVPGDRLCRTGDLARFLPDGNIQLIGRRDQQVKIRGFRVEPGEIEGVLEQHPAIVAAVVQPYESSPGTMHLAACYVLRRGMAASGTELRIFAGAKLPDYMVPAAFIAMDVLPLTPSGKIDRTVLLGLVKAATAEPQAPVRATGDTIATVFDICRHALGTGKVVIDGKLDDAGMDSTGLISIIAGIETTFDITLDDDDITPENFDTVRSIIALVEAKRLASPVS
jgi:amino acid adenylation domain-containing protein